MSRFQKLVDSNYRHFSRAAELLRAADDYAPVPIQIIEDRADDVGSFGQMRIQSDRFVFKVRRSEVAAITKGDILKVDSVYYRVKNSLFADADRLEWVVETFIDSSFVPPGEAFKYVYVGDLPLYVGDSPVIVPLEA